MLTAYGALAGGVRLSDADIDQLFSPLAKAGHLALAVSGGADSTALMHLVHHWISKRSAAPKISVLTVDHGLRAGAGAEARRVGASAAALGFPHHILRWRGEKPVRGVQEAARAARYGLMCGWCRDHGASHLLLAHHRQDQAETLMMRAARGSGPDGLCGMAALSRREGVWLARPLLELEPEALRGFLSERDLGWIEDPSNRDRRYERVRVRARLAAEGAARAEAERLLGAVAGLTRARLRREAAIDALMRRAVIASEGGFCHFDPAALRDAGAEAASRALRRMVTGVGGSAYPPRSKALEGLAERLLSDAMPGATLGGCRFFSRRGRIWAVREGRNAGEETLLQGAESRIWDRRFAVRAPQEARPVAVRALGTDWPAIRRRFNALADVPAAAGRSLPGFFSGGALLALPFAGFGGDGFKAEFLHGEALGGRDGDGIKPVRSR
ncbi:MAG: tRNA lysidine(34) synthetase TilS [Hyphomicrobiales bacterium]|nr:MAG: tRNA lysidine(34) synthetase TilS [Hyphomicrobiales bacterium]